MKGTVNLLSGGGGGARQGRHAGQRPASQPGRRFNSLLGLCEVDDGTGSHLAVLQPVEDVVDGAQRLQLDVGSGGRNACMMRRDSGELSSSATALGALLSSFELLRTWLNTAKEKA
ncbi:MAG: hypothetical protein ACRYHQ_28485 [Janthinobacterium lividum]